MSKLENIVKEYTTKKLQEIIEQQSSSYSKTFIDYAKDELIRRGQTLQFDIKLENEVAAMSDNHLKILVEKEWNNYHLEYLEIARNEYLKRGFKNESTYDDESMQQKGTGVGTRYHALRTISGVFSLLAWIIAVVAVISAIISFKGMFGMFIALLILVGGAVTVIGLFAVAESIKVIIDIEENTRKAID